MRSLQISPPGTPWSSRGRRCLCQSWNTNMTISIMERVLPTSGNTKECSRPTSLGQPPAYTRRCSRTGSRCGAAPAGGKVAIAGSPTSLYSSWKKQSLIFAGIPENRFYMEKEGEKLTPDVLVCNGRDGPHGHKVLVSRTHHKSLRGGRCRGYPITFSNSDGNCDRELTIDMKPSKSSCMVLGDKMFEWVSMMSVSPRFFPERGKINKKLVALLMRRRKSTHYIL